ncbi:hypothetical protein V2J09_003228 [Rumex salicifolius]
MPQKYIVMENQALDTGLCQGQVTATLRLGSETYTVSSKGGLLSEQLASIKEESVGILKDFITRHNVPIDVPDEPLEGSSGDEEEIVEKPPKTKKRK